MTSLLYYVENQQRYSRTQRRCSGESAHLPPMRPRFKFQHWRHVIMICELGLLLLISLALRGSSLGSAVFPSPQKPTFPNSNSTRNQVDEEPLGGCAASKSLLLLLLFIIYLYSSPRSWNFTSTCKILQLWGSLLSLKISPLSYLMIFKALFLAVSMAMIWYSLTALYQKFKKNLERSITTVIKFPRYSCRYPSHLSACLP